MKRIFSNNSDVVHTFATNDQYFGSNTRRNLYFKDNLIFSYGSHYILGTKFNINNEKHIIINDKGYSQTTNRHINQLHYATSHFIQFRTENIDLDVVHDRIKEYSLKIPRATKNKAFYIDQIKNKYEKYIDFLSYAKKHKNKKTPLNKYLIDQRSKKFKAITYIYNSIIDNLDNFQIEIIEINKKIALKKQLADQKKLKKFRNRETNYYRSNYDVLRLDHETNGSIITDYFIRSGQGIKLDIIDGLKGLKLIKNFVKYIKKANENDQSFIRGQKIGVYTIISFKNNILNIGCHKIKLSEIMQIDKEIKNLFPDLKTDLLIKKYTNEK